jgi:hypothetical protein
MTGLLSWFQRGAWHPPSPETVWGERPSLYEHIRRHLQPDGAGLASGGETLPDEEEKDDSEVRWGAGSLDGTMGHHFGAGQDPDEVGDVLRAVRAALDRAETARFRDLYELLRQGHALRIADSLLAALRESQASLPLDRLQALARWLATQAPDREPVKIGMAILGLFGGEEDRDLLLTLGRHEELTLFAAVALANLREAPEEALWELARGVTGWGRIQAVERLADAQDPRVRRWLLVEGYRNDVMYEYTAVLCAQTGGLRAELEKDPPDREVLNAARDLIHAMIVGGPAEDIDDYPEAPEVMTRYLALLQSRAETLSHFLDADFLRYFLAENEEDWAEREAHGWAPGLRRRLLAQCDEILARPHWRSQILEGFDSPERTTRMRAAAAAEALGMDVWERQFEWLAAGEPHLWYHLLQTSDPARIDRLLDLAREKIDLKSIATGPADSLGVGPAYTQHSHLDYILQELPRFPGKGWDLIRTGLRSPVVRNRNMALRALSACPRNQWEPEAEMALRRALREEPEEDVRERIQCVLVGEPLDED